MDNIDFFSPYKEKVLSVSQTDQMLLIW